MTIREQPNINGAKVLVTGGAGFVGSNLVIRLLELDVAKVIVVDNLLSSEVSNIPDDPRVSFIRGSIADPLILDKIDWGLDFVWHLACYHGNQSSIANPLEDHANNSLTSLMLFNYLAEKKIRVQKIVYAAAGCAVAQKTADQPLATSEDAPVSMFHDSPYSISKIIGEMYGNYFFTQYGLPFVRARFQNVYGPREILGAGEWRGTPATVWRNVVPTFIWKSINGMKIRLDNEGRGSRDFIYVGDLVEGLIACAIKGLPGEAYNLASGVETSIRDLASSILKLTGSSSSLELAPRRAWDHSIRRFGSTEKSSNQLAFRATTRLDDGLRATVEWTRKYQNLIMDSILKHETRMHEYDQDLN